MLAPVPLQRLEGLALLVIAVGLFNMAGESWWWFALLLLVPDLFMAGYLGGPRLGAAIYNLGHTLIWPLGLLAFGMISDTRWLEVAGAVWLAHIGMDRALGYGLKHSDSFQHTHLGLIGRGRRPAQG
ncbi:MAG TPA: DUF4260 domain-containing protein [Acidimicrobiia bacterium]